MKSLKDYFCQYDKAAPLAVFRICFGLLMFLSMARFWVNGWIKKLYIEPNFHFSYLGFEWVKPIGNWTYLIFAICALSALLVMLGWRYRVAIIVFFLSFTYIELMDKTTYLNHYYFISIMSFLLIFLPANVAYSFDAKRNKKLQSDYVPRFSIDVIKALMCLVYFYAGLAKLNSDWLVKAQPLKTWLATKVNLPIIGQFMEQDWLAYTFSYAGAAYDLLIPFFLLYKPSRKIAFLAVIVFHVLTRILFPIGMFPFIMIVSALIFFSPEFHEKLLSFFRIKTREVAEKQLPVLQNRFRAYKKIALPVIAALLVSQLLLPWRYLGYPEELFWTEEGFRFSWRVMLMEKAGYAQFTVVDHETKKKFAVDNSDFLTPFQEKQMSFQPDFILEYAHFLHDHFEKQGVKEPEVYVESYVALNGRLSQPYINSEVNLAAQKRGFHHKDFILPFNDTIHGL